MINRVFIKELLSFDKITLKLSNGLNIITGPSGAGKSIFINSILANFAFTSQEAKLCEIEIENPKNLKIDTFDLDEEYLVIKSIKKDRVRFFLNEQNISKKTLKNLFANYIHYISVRDKKAFENEKLIELVDNYIEMFDKNYQLKIKNYKDKFFKYQQSKKEFEDIRKKSKEANEKIEFLKFEIHKIESINPKEGEYEELLEIKKRLSKLDKISQISSQIENIFNYEDSVYELFEILNKDSNYFSDALNQLRSDLDDINSLKEELNEINIEEILNRLEDLNYLIKRFGSIKEAKEYLNRKKEELKGFENIEENSKELEIFLKESLKELEKEASEISNIRKKNIIKIEEELEKYLKELKLPSIKFIFEKKDIFDLGMDKIDLSLEGSKIDTLSGGEFNRVRLALLSIGVSKKGGIIILDEIDANVSGDESIAIANMISNLSKYYQIFAISHQAHLSAKADNHILIFKKDKRSRAKVLNKEEREKEIARIIAGEKFNEESLKFAKKLFEK